MKRSSSNLETLDVVVIGGGISGLVFLAYARQKKLSALLLEKKEGLGGLWSSLPEWQDIQIKAEDWSINDLPITGVDQKAILANILAWEKRYQLSPFIRTKTNVTSIVRENDFWSVHTDESTIKAKNVVVASGTFNIPRFPQISHQQSKLQETHSFELKDKTQLKGKRVAILGGWASAWDSIELALQQGASDIHWIYRSNHWMYPSTRPKYESSDLRVLGYQQYWAEPTALNNRLRELLKAKYEYFGIRAVQPEADYRYGHDLLVGGRPNLIKHFKSIKRHLGTIKSIAGHTIFTDQDQFDADILIYATGYDMDLHFLGLPEYKELKTIEQLNERLALRFIALDYPNLYFLNHGFHSSNSSVPFTAAVLSKSIVSAIRGKAQFPKTVCPEIINYLDLCKVLAPYDRSNYPFWWRLKAKVMAWWHFKHRQKQLKV